MYKGKESITSFLMVDKGTYIEVTATITQKRSVDLKEWEEKSFAVKAIDSTQDKAFRQSVQMLNKVLMECEEDLFKLDNKEGEDV
jgi:hypothetical protein